MSFRKSLLAALTLLLLIPAAALRSADQTLIAGGSAWKYNDSGANLGTAWRAPAYDDAAWPAGPAPLGYGDGDEATVVSYGTSTTNRRITYYFRRAFTVADPAAIEALSLRYLRDDGCVIYLNGVEIVRSNMPTGTVTYTTRASASIGGADESAWLQAPVDPSRLVTGTNVVAVEIHQNSPTSSDISFDSRAARHRNPDRRARREPRRSGEPERLERLRGDVARLGVGAGRARRVPPCMSRARRRPSCSAGRCKCRTRRLRRRRQPFPTGPARPSTSTGSRRTRTA